MAWPAGQNSHRWTSGDYDVAFLLLRFRRLRWPVFCDVPSPAAGYISHRSRAGTAFDLSAIRIASGVGIVSCRGAVQDSMDELRVSLCGKFAEYADHKRNRSGAAFLDCRCAGLWPPRRNYFAGVAANAAELPDVAGTALPVAVAA